MTGGETWGKAETVGRRSRRMRVEVEMVRERRRGGEEKEEEGRRSCMEDCSCRELLLGKVWKMSFLVL